MAHSHVYSLRAELGLSVIHETEQDYKLEIRDSQNLAENEEQRNLRLQRLRESQSIRIQAETKQQRHDRLQIARDNTARRTTKQTPTASTPACSIDKIDDRKSNR